MNRDDFAQRMERGRMAAIQRRNLGLATGKGAQTFTAKQLAARQGDSTAADSWQALWSMVRDDLAATLRECRNDFAANFYQHPADRYDLADTF